MPLSVQQADSDRLSELNEIANEHSTLRRVLKGYRIHAKVMRKRRDGCQGGTTSRRPQYPLPLKRIWEWRKDEDVGDEEDDDEEGTHEVKPATTTKHSSLTTASIW